MKKGLEKGIQQAVQAIHKADKIIVASHVNPDGDTIGCLLALGLSLLQIGKKVILLSQDGVPTRFQFLPGSELILSDTSETADVAIAVDCGSLRQIGKLKAAFFRAKTTIQVDHHDFGQSFGKIQVLEEEAAAVGEIVYELLRALKVEMTPAIATCLLTSIIVDTGSFQFANIRSKTFDISSRLLKNGVNLQHLIEESYWKKSRSMAKLSGYCMMKSHFSANGAIAWATVYQRDFRRFGAHQSDVDSVADDLRSIEGVKIAAVFRETEKHNFRVSLRSSDGIHVASVARAFGGGGHHNSAGCLIRNSENEKKRLLKELEILVG
jgi:phosphoesterase RecJ-like protein